MHGWHKAFHLNPLRDSQEESGVFLPSKTSNSPFNYPKLNGLNDHDPFYPLPGRTDRRSAQVHPGKSSGYLMVTQGSNGLEANLVSYTLVKENEKSVLRAHLARINPQLADLKASKEATIIFQEPQGLHHTLMVSDKERAQEGSPNLELHNRKSLGNYPDYRECRLASHPD